MKKSVIALAGSLALIALSCSKTNEEALRDAQNGGTGNPACDTVNMKYAANVAPILAAHCYICHGTATNSTSGGIVLEGYSNLKVMADNGNLIGAISHAAGYPAMPQNAAKLSDCDINTIRSWIDNGTQNN